MNIKLEYHQNINGIIEKKDLEFPKNLLKEPYNLNSLFVSMVDGQSMEPDILHGSLVIADLSQKEFEDESIYLIYKDNNMWIKKSKFIDNNRYFVSINPKYSHLTYKFEDCRVIAKVLLTFKNL
ncbi:hypothetical protein ACBT_1423 [Aliarcobacter cibarius]|uniref:Uncharacterized protein n=1 Tax=Aliarcobacter cibarius TaxID=255507 RepID=A0A5J6RGS7_9BACT|nr:S24 family peptidase [Aliarcobacter cibarius]QEZ89296.1 hypothetical protein ACIB15232_1184 [Aliarcobacter cibarius]QKJ27329.1 hypothetical protein ACBT_1423 [Aliarcobacter cibarius]